MRAVLLLFIIAVLAWVTGCPLAPTTDPSTITLDSGFSVEVRSGNTTGQDESAVCSGFFPRAPTLRLTIAVGLPDMIIRVESMTADADVAVLVRGPDGTLCASGARPELAREFWQSGEYEIFVGTTERDTSADYRVAFFEAPA